MKALLLAAGRGTRISRHLNGNPKCTVDIGNGVALVEYTITQLKKHGINEIALVTGYRHEVIENLLKDKGVKFFFNPFYDVTNSLASAWFAKEFIKDDDLLIMNADVFCEEQLYDEMLSVTLSPVLFYDTSRIKEADYKFYCKNNHLIKYGKELTPEETSGEYVGIATFNKEFIPVFMQQMDIMIRNQQHSIWWENIIYSMSSERDIFTYDVNGKFWAEVDYIEDYNRIRAFVNDRLQK